MPHAIARIVKLNAGNIDSSALHTARKITTLNANSEVDNIRFVGEGDNRPLKEAVIERIGEQTIRKNAVLAVEILLTASPEYFRPEEPSRAGYYELEKLEEWQQQVRSWLDNEYGDRIVRAELHLDESTPHVHAYLVPLDERGKLNCRGIFGGREKMSRFQDSYAAAMSPLGLERGVKGSKAKHTKIKQYYAAVNSPPNQSLSKETIQHQLEDRIVVISKNKQLSFTVKHLDRENQKLRQELQKAKLEIKSQSRESDRWRSKYESSVANLRELPLAKVAAELGLIAKKDKHKWQSEQHTISINGSKFYDWKRMEGGGGAIDLVMYVNEINFKEAVAWLGDRFDEAAVVSTANEQIRQIIQDLQKKEFVPPKVVKENWSKVKNYLTKQRKLPSRLIESLHEAGVVYADDKQNVVFLRRSVDGTRITGANLRGTVGDNNKFKGLAQGTKRSQGWFYFEQGEQSIDSIKRVVLVESPIDAMSLSVLERTDSKKTMYLSTDGAGDIPLELLERKEVVVAYDNDEAGAAMAEALKEKLKDAKRKLPKAKDWNEDLINTFNWSSKKQIRKAERYERGSKGGFSL